MLLAEKSEYDVKTDSHMSSSILQQCSPALISQQSLIFSFFPALHWLVTQLEPQFIPTTLFCVLQLTFADSWMYNCNVMKST